MLRKDESVTDKYVTYRDKQQILRVSLVDNRDHNTQKNAILNADLQRDFSMQEFAAHEYRKVKRNHDSINTISKPPEAKP